MPESKPRNRRRQREARALARTTGLAYQTVVTEKTALPRPGAQLAFHEYEAAGLARFGTSDQSVWTWTCPHCLWITTPAVYQEAGADPALAASECLALHRTPLVGGPRRRGDFHERTSMPCTATAEELPAALCYTVVCADGTRRRVFPFTETGATLEGNRELWRARVHADHERREAARCAELERRRAQAKAEGAPECLGCEEPEGLPHTDDCLFRTASLLGRAETVTDVHVMNDPDTEVERWQGMDTWLLRYEEAVRTALGALGHTVCSPLYSYLDPDVGESASIDIDVTTPDGGRVAFSWYDYSGWRLHGGDNCRPRNRGEQNDDGYVPRVDQIAQEIAAILGGDLTWNGPEVIYHEPTEPEVFRSLLGRLAEAVEEAEAVHLPAL